MNENFHYFALNYLNDWLNIDRPLFERLKKSSNAQTGREALVAIAKQYGVARCFLKKHEKGRKRLDPVYRRLQKIGKPSSQTSAIEAVSKLESKLAKLYEQKTLSATSKLLWFKFQSPVVIYDSRAVRALELRTTDNYETYYLAWRTMYLSYQKQIKQCCKSLPRARKYAVTGLSKDEICKITNKRWFRERVFDKFLYYNGPPKTKQTRT